MKDLKLVQKIAWSYHKTTGIELDELIQECALAYCLSLKYYDEKKSKLTTFVWYYIHGHVNNYLKKRKKEKFIEYLEDKPLKDSLTFPNELFEKLSLDEQEIVKIILSRPKLFVCPSAKQAKRRLIRIMIKKGWELEKTLVNLKNLRLTFTN